MKFQNAYTGIDYFRFAAAFLVVAIHTAPLSGINSTADFLLTRGIGRIAVPFFFVTSGFFLLRRPHKSALSGFLRKTAVIYGGAILLCLPINIYQGYFQQPNILLRLLQDLLVNGTVYHLWYLPASMAGALISWMLIRKFGYRVALPVTLLLYLIGLLGDSYYGLTAQFETFSELYEGIFTISQYTRNGFFFAPLFFTLGGLLSSHSVRISTKFKVTGLILSLGILTAEALLLRHLDWPRHDSMYLFLPVVLFFLFSTLMLWRGRRSPLSYILSLTVYLIHPLMIIAVRIVAKLLRLERMLIFNHMVHFLLVLALSIITGFLAAWTVHYWKQYKLRSKTANTWLEIDLEKLKHNARQLQQLMPDTCRLMAVVKANAYGHGDVLVSRFLFKAGIRTFAVATMEEGIRLRKHLIRGEILVFGYTPPECAGMLERYRLTQTVASLSHASGLEQHARNLKVHLKVDTGMHRLGIDSRDTDAIAEVFHYQSLHVTGVYTHLSTADSRDAESVSHAMQQIQDFYRVVEILEEQGIALPAVHIQSSYGLLNYPELNCDYVRAGIALYGAVLPEQEQTKLTPDLEPVLSWKSRIASVRRISAGECVGYGMDHCVSRESQIAAIPVGYADGYPRSLSFGDGCYALIHGKRAPLVGRVCMDQLLLDITDIPDALAGDTVTLLGQDGRETLHPCTLAGWSGSIPNELLSRLGSRPPRIRKSTQSLNKIDNAPLYI